MVLLTELYRRKFAACTDSEVALTWIWNQKVKRKVSVIHKVLALSKFTTSPLGMYNRRILWIMSSDSRILLFFKEELLRIPRSRNYSRSCDHSKPEASRVFYPIAIEAVFEYDFLVFKVENEDFRVFSSSGGAADWTCGN